MAKIDFFLVVLLITYNEILCSLLRNENSLLKPNVIRSYRPKFNGTISKVSNRKYPYSKLYAANTKNESDESILNTTDHIIPHSEHENPKNISTKPKYTVNGQLIHPKKKEEFLDFIPTKLYAQVRGKHTVKRVPKKYAVEEATTNEEKENANRLREVVTNKKTNTIYTEEGYEDSAYDHAGHIRDADFEEQFGRKLKNKYNEKNESNFPTKKGRKYTSDEDVTYANSISNHNVNKEKHNIPKKIVLKGLRNLESDIAKEIEETENKADEYHERISKIKASEENNDDDAYNDDNDNENADYKESGEDYEDYEEDDEENKSTSSSKSLEDGSSQKRLVSHEDEDSSTGKYIDYSSSREQSKEDRSMGSSSRSTEDGDSKIVKINQENENSSSREFSTIPPNKEERINSVEYRGAIKFRSNEQSQESSKSVENERYNQNKDGVIHKNSGETERLTTESAYRLFDFTTVSPAKFSFGDILWEAFKNRQKQRALSNPSNIKSSESNLKHNTLVSTGNADPYFEKLLLNPVRVEPLTVKPIRYGLIEDNLLNSNPTDNSFINIENPLHLDQIEPLTLIPPNPEPIISFDPVVSSELYEFNEESTTPAYTTTFLNSAYVIPTTTEKKTEFDHNPFLSPFAKQFDGKLKRYHLIPRDKPINIKIEDELQPPKFNNNIKHFNIFEYNSGKKNIYPNKIPYKLNSYQSLPINNKQKSIPTELELSILKPPKFVKSRLIPNVVRYKRPILGDSGSYDPILNDYILPRIVKNHFYPSLNLSPAAETKNLYPIYNAPNTRNNKIVSSHVYPNRITKPQIIRLKRSLKPTVIIALDHIINKYNSLNSSNINGNKKQESRSLKYKNRPDLLGKSPNIVQSVVDKEIELRFPNKDNKTDESDKLSEEIEKGNVEVEIPELDEFLDDTEEYERKDYPDSEKEELNKEKYPYYGSDLAKQYSTLNYIMNPNYVPKKTFGGMEFYDSRILECNEIDPDLTNVAPSGEEPTTTQGYNENLPRLNGLGDKLDCLKAKYFDPNPLDNPLFMEKRIDTVEIPAEIDPQKFSSKISDWSSQRDDYINQKLSKSPEYDEKGDTKIENLKKKHTYKHLVSHKYKHPRKRIIKRKKKRKPSNQSLVPLRLYGNQVYDDVMGTIKKSKSIKKYKPHHRKRNPNYIDEITAVKLRFVPKNSKAPPSSSQIDAKPSSIPIINIPSTHLPTKVKILKGGPFESINISKPKGSNLRINYHALPGIQKYQKIKSTTNKYKHKHHKRSVSNKSESDDNTDESIITNSHQLNLNSKVIEEQPVQNSSYKVIYREPVRRKNTKPKGDHSRYGEFVQDSTSSRAIDTRRQEPRYNPVKVQKQELPVTIKPSLHIVVKDPVEIKRVPSIYSTPVETVFQINHNHQNNTPHQKIYQEISRNEKNDSALVNDDSLPKKIEKRYEVHEIPNEDLGSQSKSKLDSKPTVKDYSTEEEDETLDYQDDKTETVENHKSQDDENTTVEETSNYNSSEEKSANNGSDSKENDDQSEEKEDKNTFSRFNFRPYSPPEYYEDPKYTDLGPRVNKPAFHHPKFKVPKYEYYKFGKHVGDVSDESYESEESGEKNKYVYPWDKHESDESKHFVHSIKRYEFPWEKRARLEREKNKKKYYYSSEENDDEDGQEEEETASSEDFYTYESPYNVKIYKTPKRKNRNKKNFYYDNEEGTSNVKTEVVHTTPPNIAIIKENKTVTEIINDPIVSTNQFSDKEVLLKQNIKVTTPLLPLITATYASVTANPLVASASGKRNVDILKTNPRRRETSPTHLTSSITTSLPNIRRRMRLKNNLSTTTETSSTLNTYLRRRKLPGISST